MSEPSVDIIRREERLKLEVFRDDEAAAEAAAEILAPQVKIPVAELLVGEVEHKPQ